MLSDQTLVLLHLCHGPLWYVNESSAAFFIQALSGDVGLHLRKWRESLESRQPLSIVCNMLEYSLYVLCICSICYTASFPWAKTYFIKKKKHSISLMWNGYIIYFSWITQSANHHILLWFTDLSHVNTRLHLSHISISLYASGLVNLLYLWWGEKDSGSLPGSWASSPNERSLHHYRLTWSLDACLRLLMGWWDGVLRKERTRQQQANAVLCVWATGEWKWVKLCGWDSVFLSGDKRFSLQIWFQVKDYRLM